MESLFGFRLIALSQKSAATGLAPAACSAISAKVGGPIEPVSISTIMVTSPFSPLLDRSGTSLSADLGEAA